MPTDIFYWLLNMSIVASLAGLVIGLLRLIPALPRRFIYPLWAVVLLRLWLPFGFASDFSILQLLPHKVVYIPDTYFPLSSALTSQMNCIMGVNSYFPIVYKSETLELIFTIASAIWVIAAAVLLGFVAVSYVQTLRQSCQAAHWKDNLYLSAQVTGPMVCGILRPRILLPRSYENRELDWILAHERTHIRRLDNLWRLLGLITACLHWFNPLIWLFLKWFLADLELSCDEAVLRRCTAEDRKSYAHTLLNSQAQRSFLASPFGHADTAMRIRRILSYRNLSITATIFVCLAATCISLALLTNAR